ncbi:MAG: Cof-type HAD-IIB family hydrolase [Cellulosilyticaceae bacterium]
MIKAIFFDVDGTLVTFGKNRYVPQSTKDALALLREKGIKLFLATGRAPVLVKELKNMLDFEFDGYVTMNGQYCFNDEGIIHEVVLDIGDLKNLIEHTEKNDIGCHFVELELIYINRLNDNVKKALEMFELPLEEVKIIDPKRAYEYPTYQLTAYITKEEEQQLLDCLPNCKSARWHDDFTDIIPKTGGKSIGIQKILEHYKIDRSETMAFGDGGNDIDMLEYVEVGIAMGNAKDDVKMVADYITTNVDDDGIMNAVKHFNQII